MRALLAVPLVVAVLAGCLSAPAPSVESAPAETATTSLAALDLVATGCREGGGHSVHPKEYQELPEPWVPADILEDVGPQVVWSEYVDPLNPSPDPGETFGNWHATVLCESMTFRGRALEPAFFGYVGERVERPVFDTSTGPEPDHHYLVTVVAVADDELLRAFHDAGIQAMKASATWEDIGGGFDRILMTTELNGAYDSVQSWKAWGEPTAHTRVWFQDTGKELPHGAEGHTPHMDATPTSFDMWTTGGEHIVAEGQGYFSHSGTQHHGGLPGAGHTAALGYRDFDRTWTWGPSYPDVKLTQVWDH